MALKHHCSRSAGGLDPRPAHGQPRGTRPRRSPDRAPGAVSIRRTGGSLPSCGIPPPSDRPVERPRGPARQARIGEVRDLATDGRRLGSWPRSGAHRCERWSTRTASRSRPSSGATMGAPWPSSGQWPEATRGRTATSISSSSSSRGSPLRAAGSGRRTRRSTRRQGRHRYPESLRDGIRDEVLAEAVRL